MLTTIIVSNFYKAKIIVVVARQSKSFHGAEVHGHSVASFEEGKDLMRSYLRTKQG